MRSQVRVVRVYHSAVVTAFRARDRHLRAAGVEELLVTARVWDEGGRKVRYAAADREAEWVWPTRTFGRHPHAFVYGLRVLCRALRTAPDVIDVHEEPDSLAAGQVLLLRWLLRSRSPIIFYSAQNLLKRYPLPFRWIETWALRSASAIYCCSAGAAEVIRAKGFGGDVVVVGLGVDVDQFSPAKATRRSQSRGPLQLIYVGRLLHHKGVHVLLQALATVEGAQLQIIGDGPERADLARTVELLNLRSRVEFRSFVSHDQLPGMYRGADVAVIPSIPTSRWSEQFCRVAVEAMASGLAVVASADGSLPEVIGEVGLLVPPDDVTALAAALTNLRDDRALLDRLRRLSPERAARYRWSAVAEAHRGLYERAVS